MLDKELNKKAVTTLEACNFFHRGVGTLKLPLKHMKMASVVCYPFINEPDLEKDIQVMSALVKPVTKF